MFKTILDEIIKIEDARVISELRKIAQSPVEHTIMSNDGLDTTGFEVGDLIEAIPPWALACGSGLYRRAVLVSIEPFVAVSEEGDMMWNTNIRPEKVRRIGKAFSEVFEVAMKRFNSGY